MDSLKLFWHLNVMNPYTHLITLLHVMRRHMWTATRTEMIVFKMTSIIPPSACMMNERDKKNCTIRVREGTPRCLVNHPSRPSVSLKNSHKMCVCVCVFMWFMRTHVCIMTWVWHRYYKEKVIYEDIFSGPIIQNAYKSYRVNFLGVK